MQGMGGLILGPLFWNAHTALPYTYIGKLKYRGRLALKGFLEFHSLRAIAEGSRPKNSRRPTRAKPSMA